MKFNAGLNLKYISDIFSFSSEDALTQSVRDMSTWIDHQGDMEDCYHDNKIRCYAYVQDGGFCVRTNTISAYSESNKLPNGNNR
jgi:hypothetical protein